MAHIVLKDLDTDLTLDRAALRQLTGGIRFGGFGWIRPYQAQGSQMIAQGAAPVTIVNYFIEELNQVVNNNTIMTSINVDASGNSDSDVSVNASPVQMVNQSGTLTS